MKKNILLFIICIVIAVCAYKTSIGVRELKKDIVSMDNQMLVEKEKSTVLDAEWAYLNRNERLEQLSQVYLDLQKVQPKQIVRVDSLSSGINFASLGLTYKVASLEEENKKPLEKS